MEPKIFLSLDQALQTTGFAIFQLPDKLVHYGSFSVPKNLTIEKRLGIFFAKLTEIYKEYPFQKIYLEDIQLQTGNVLTYKHLAYVQATIYLWCYFQNIDFVTTTASHWRKQLGGHFGRKREEQKQHACELVKNKYNIEVTSDEADAICIGMSVIEDKSKVAF